MLSAWYTHFRGPEYWLTPSDCTCPFQVGLRSTLCARQRCASARSLHFYMGFQKIAEFVYVKKEKQNLTTTAGAARSFFLHTLRKKGYSMASTCTRWRRGEGEWIRKPSASSSASLLIIHQLFQPSGEHCMLPYLLDHQSCVGNGILCCGVVVSSITPAAQPAMNIWVSSSAAAAPASVAMRFARRTREHGMPSSIGRRKEARFSLNRRGTAAISHLHHAC